MQLPSKPYNNYKLIDCFVDKFLTVKVQGNRYSVPQKYVGKKVTIELGLSDVRITYKNKLIAKHKRSLNKDIWVLEPFHYINLLCRKNRAFEDSRVSTVIEKQWPDVVKKLWDMQMEKYGKEEGTKEFLYTLKFFQDKDFTAMTTIFELAMENKTCSKESISMIFESLTEEREVIEEAQITDIKEIATFEIPQPDVEKFDLLMEGLP